MKNPHIFAFADEADSSIDGQIRAMLRNGLDGLEIRGVDGASVSAISLEKAREVRKKLDDNGLITWSIGSPIGKISVDADFKAHTEVFRHVLEIADVLGAKNLRMFSFYTPAGQNPDNYRNLIIDQLGQLLDIARGSGVALCHENEKGIYGDISERCLVLHKALPELRGVFDPSNYVQCGDDTLRGWARLKPYIHYLHIKDALSDGSVVPAGCGTGNVAFIVQDYLRSGGSAMTVEPHLTVFEGLHTLEPADAKHVGGYAYASKDIAFDAACDALKTILEKLD